MKVLSFGQQRAAISAATQALIECQKTLDITGYPDSRESNKAIFYLSQVYATEFVVNGEHAGVQNSYSINDYIVDEYKKAFPDDSSRLSDYLGTMACSFIGGLAYAFKDSGIQPQQASPSGGKPEDIG